MSRAATTVLAILGTSPWTAAGQSCPADTISRVELAEAMREARTADPGSYDILATTNSMRFQSAVLQWLIERHLEHVPGGGTFFIPHDALWWEFLTAAGLRPEEQDRAPIGRRLAFEYQQSIEVTFGPPASFIKETKRGPAPLLMANVTLEWPDRPDGARKFAFVDTLSVPKLKVTNHQLLRFRFLVFDDMTVLDEIDGISGRPLSGFLATIFKVIGEGDAVFSRFTISTDGLQIVRAKAKKLVSRTVTATIGPDGKAQNGVPDGRADLTEIDRRLQQPLEYEYFPYRC